MKKIMLFLMTIMTMCLIACDTEPEYDPYDRYGRHHDQYGPNDRNSNGDDNNENTNQGQNNDNNNSNNNNQNNTETRYTITKLYAIVMRRTLPYPFSVYVLQIDNGAYFYMLRYRFNQDLSVGDKISFGVYSYCPNEIAVINGCELGDGEDAEQSSSAGAGEYLVASDPIEATVKEMFSMEIIYAIPLFPIDTWFIETTDGNLVYVKKSKLNVSLKPGDRFVYNTYTIFPNEILAIKKL